jgi:hypothetical protein
MGDKEEDNEKGEALDNLENDTEQVIEDENALKNDRTICNKKPIDRLTYSSMVQAKINEEQEILEHERKHNLFSRQSSDKDFEYDEYEATTIGLMMEDINNKYPTESSFIQQYMLEKGIKKFGEEGKKAAIKEMEQIHNRKCFEPINIEELNNNERKKAQIALAFLTEKRTGVIKGRTVYNGKPTREWLDKQDSASPTVTLESILLTTVIDAHEDRDVMTVDVPNAFIQTELPQVNGECVVMKITGYLVDILIKIDPELYKEKVVYEKGRRVLYVVVLKAIYGMLVAALLFYKKFRKDLESIGFKFNPYDPCVANRMIDDKQHTVRFHVDDLMSSHVDSSVNDKFKKWLNETYGGYGEVVATRGKIHDYLGMTVIFKNGEVRINMIDYIRDMLAEFPVKFKKSDRAVNPATADLFKEDTGKKLNENEREIFHRTVAKALFMTYSR